MLEEEASSRFNVLFQNKQKKHDPWFFSPLLHYSPHALQKQGKSVRLKTFFFNVLRGGRIFARGKNKILNEPHLKCPHAHVLTTQIYALTDKEALADSDEREDGC